MKKFGMYVAVVFSPVLLVVLLAISAAQHQAVGPIELAPQPGTAHTAQATGPRAQADKQTRHTAAVAPGQLPQMPIKPNAPRAGTAEVRL